MKRRLRGFTLTEMIIAFVLLMMIIAASGTVLMATTDIFSRQATTARAQTIGNGINDFVSDKLECAVNIYLTNAPVYNTEELEAYDEVIYIDNGRVCYAATAGLVSYERTRDDLYGEEYYCGCNVRFEFKLHDSSLADITTSIYPVDKNGAEDELPEFSRESMIKLLNLTEENAGNITAEDGKTYSSKTGKLYIYIKQ